MAKVFALYMARVDWGLASHMVPQVLPKWSCNSESEVSTEKHQCIPQTQIKNNLIENNIQK